MFADYIFYQETYLGNKITATDFDRLIIRAGFYLQQITGGKAEKQADTEAVKMAACAVAEVWQENEQGGAVISESVGKWSRSYAEPSQSTSQQLYNAAALYLSGTGLLSRWC